MARFDTPDGGRLVYQHRHADTERPAAVFVNGFGQTLVYWDPIVKALAPDRGTLTYDARGQGRSGGGDGRLDLARQVADLAGLCRHLGIAAAHLVGVSRGALVAAGLAAAGPALCRSLTLMGTGVVEPSARRALIGRWQRILAERGLPALAEALIDAGVGPAFRNAHRRIVPRMVDAVVRRNRIDGMAALLSAMAGDPPIESVIEGVRAPVQVIAGEMDAVVPVVAARALADRCEGRFHSLDGIGHSIPAEAPGAVSAMLREFMAAHEQRGKGKDRLRH